MIFFKFTLKRLIRSFSKSVLFTNSTNSWCPLIGCLDLSMEQFVTLSNIADVAQSFINECHEWDLAVESCWFSSFLYHLYSPCALLCPKWSRMASPFGQSVWPLRRRGTSVLGCSPQWPLQRTQSRNKHPNTIVCWRMKHESVGYLWRKPEGRGK